MCGLSDEEIWDQLGVMVVGEWTLADLWDRARLLGVPPADLFSGCLAELAA